MNKQIQVKKIHINDREYISSMSIGIAPRERVEFSLKNGLLIFDREYGDYGMTTKIKDYENFWGWLQGNDNALAKRNIGDWDN